VYKALDQDTGGLIAVKLLPLKNSSGVVVEKNLKVIAKEVRLMRRLEHPHIVRYLGCDQVPGGLAVLMELVPGGGTLRELIKEFGALPEQVVKGYTQQMLSGLAYLHSQGVVHRDIKGALRHSALGVALGLRRKQVSVVLVVLQPDRDEMTFGLWL